MENTTVNSDLLLEQVNNEQAELMAPVMIYLGIVMLVGLFGNGMACYFYNCESKQSSNTVLIAAVTAYDLILCGVSIPFEITELRFFYLFTNSGACKCLRFVNYFGTVGSAFTLLVIAADRYRKICKPFKRQLKLKEARIACGILVLVSLAISWPALVFYRSVKVDIQTKNGTVVKGFDCTTTRRQDYKLYLLIFNGFYLISFVISSFSLCVMYILVGRVLLRQKRNRRHTLMQTATDSNSRGADNDRNEYHQTENSVMEPKVTISFETTYSTASGMTLPRTRQSNICRTTQNQLNISNVKYTSMMFVITVVFILSYLPHLTLALWQALTNEYESNVLSEIAVIAFQIGLRSYFLNSAINPFVYGFFNPNFRQFFCKTFSLRGREQTESNTVSTRSSEINANNVL